MLLLVVHNTYDFQNFFIKLFISVLWSIFIIVKKNILVSKDENSVTNITKSIMLLKILCRGCCRYYSLRHVKVINSFYFEYTDTYNLN